MKICFHISIEAIFFGPFLFLHTAEEGSVEDKKFISPKRFIGEKFRLQKVGVVEVFLYYKVVSIFHFEQFLTLLIVYLPNVNELSRQRGRCLILIFHFFHTLGCLVSCPPFIFGVIHNLT